MCFEVPALVPPGGANGNKGGSADDDDANDDDLGIMDIDENDNKAGMSSNSACSSRLAILKSKAIFVPMQLGVLESWKH